MPESDPIFRDPPGDLVPFAVLDAAGGVVADLPEVPDPAEREELYRWMVFGRTFDRRLIALQRQGRIGTIGSVEGQEAVEVGVPWALSPADWVLGTYRDLLAYLVRGVPLRTVFAFARGDLPGPFPVGTRALPIQVVVGAHAAHAVGVALAVRRRGEDAVALALMGDGATSEGEVHEAVNFAGVFQVPAVFVVHNNGWAISVPRERQSRAASLAQKAWGHGVAAAAVDGSDVLAVAAAVRRARRRAAAGLGPCLVEVRTVRIGPHTTSDDPRRYRDQDALEREREALDPIGRLARHLAASGVDVAALATEAEERAEALVAEGIGALEAEAELAPEALVRLTYRNPPPGWLERTLARIGEVAG